MARAPASDTMAPAPAQRGNGSRSKSAPSRMMKIGVGELRIGPLIALVYCKPQYLSTLCSPPPSRPRPTIGPPLRLISPPLAHHPRPPTREITPSAIAHH